MPDLSSLVQTPEPTPQENEQVVTMTIPDIPAGDVNIPIANPAVERPMGEQPINPPLPVIEEPKVEFAPEPLTSTEPSKPVIKEVDKGGRPCKYCENKEHYQKITNDYLNKYEVSDKPIIPFIEELSSKLKVHRETILEWSKNEADHPEFSDTIKYILNLQRLRLMQRTLGRFNPTGAIFQLKANHNFIETDKRVLAGLKDEPLQVEIIEETKSQDE